MTAQLNPAVLAALARAALASTRRHFDDGGDAGGDGGDAGSSAATAAGEAAGYGNVGGAGVAGEAAGIGVSTNGTGNFGSMGDGSGESVSIGNPSAAAFGVSPGGGVGVGGVGGVGTGGASASGGPGAGTSGTGGASTGSVGGGGHGGVSTFGSGLGFGLGASGVGNLAAANSNTALQMRLAQLGAGVSPGLGFAGVLGNDPGLANSNTGKLALASMLGQPVTSPNMTAAQVLGISSLTPSMLAHMANQASNNSANVLGAGVGAGNVGLGFPALAPFGLGGLGSGEASLGIGPAPATSIAKGPGIGVGGVGPSPGQTFGFGQGSGAAANTGVLGIPSGMVALAPSGQMGTAPAAHGAAPTAPVAHTSTLTPAVNGSGRGQLYMMRGGVARADGGETPDAGSLSALRNKWGQRGVTLDAYDHSSRNLTTLHKIEVPHEQRNRGVGTAAMNDLIAHADRNNRTLALTPSKDFGASSVGRLNKFYKRFGFVDNSGRNRDFTHSESMYRPPRPQRADGGGLPELPHLSGAREARELPGQHHAPHAHKLHVGPIHSAVAGRTDHLPTTVPSGSYILPADIVSGLGEGNTTAGFKVLQRIFSGMPYGGDGNPYRQGALPYGRRANGGQIKDEGVPCVLAGGEFCIAPHHVDRIGNGDRDAGHKTLDAFVKGYREKTVKTLKKLPGPARD